MSGGEGAVVRRGGEEVLEGFLCPFCMVDLTSITQLQAHFEEQHASEDKATLQALKGFLSKAKKKFLNEDEPDGGGARGINPFEEDTVEYESNNPWNWDPPALGPSRNHTASFKNIRSARIDASVAETNKLLIRLDKLLRDLPNDPVKRKAHERSIVMWVEDRDVPLCPFCARSFNIARRRHHCRLCGGVMCNECSYYLTFDYAKKLVNPVHQGSAEEMSKLANSSGVGSGVTSLLSGFSGLRRSNSLGSLNSLLSVMDSMTAEQHFRTCAHCMMRLQARDNQVELRTSKTTLALYYEKLMEYRAEIERLLPQYIRIAESLQSGETTYSLRDAEELRIRILKKGDGLNSMSQRIRTLGSEDPPSSSGDPPPPMGPRQSLLQRRIHSTATAFLKENILTLPKLPTQVQLKELQERRRLEAEARLAAEKEAARQAEARAAEILRRRDRDSPRSTPPHIPRPSPTKSSPSTLLALERRQNTQEVMVDTGWGADSAAHNVSETDDPFIQQMNIIRNTIRQAREAGRDDNIAALQDNLRDLQEEYKKQQRLMNP